MLNRSWFDDWKKEAIPLAEEAIRDIEQNIWKGHLPTSMDAGWQAQRLYAARHRIARVIAPEFEAEWPEFYGARSAGSAEEVDLIRSALYEMEHAATGRPLFAEVYPDGYDSLLTELTDWLAGSAADMAWGCALRRHYLGRKEGAS